MLPLYTAPKTTGAAIAAVSFLLMQFMCDRIADPFRPFSHSTATLAGYVCDSLSNEPVGGASVTVAGEGTAVKTAVNGRFQVHDVPTGNRIISISAPEYATLQITCDVTLEPAADTFRLIREDRPPVIHSVTVDTAALRFCNDPLTVVFKAADFSGGITGAVLYTGDTAGTGKTEMAFMPPMNDVNDSFTIAYSSRDTFNARLEITDARGETSIASFTVFTSKPRRPSFGLLRTSKVNDTVDGFISGEPGYVQLMIDDNDHVYKYLSITWGDNGDSLIDFGRQGTYWHEYTVAGTAVYSINVTLFDAAGAVVNDTVLPVVVAKINPPLLDGKLFFEPCQYCAPHDDSILIGVRIREIKDGWVDQIIWTVNEDDPEPAFRYRRVTYGSITGAVSDSIGNLFVCRFATTGFKGTNIVQIRVVDNAGNSSTVSGNFYIAGKPD